jgi:predicted transcriptional regulator
MSFMQTLINSLGQQATAAAGTREKNKNEALALLQSGFVPQGSPLAAQIEGDVQEDAPDPDGETVQVGQPSRFDNLDSLLKQSFLPEQPLDPGSFVPSQTNPQVVARRGQDLDMQKHQETMDSFHKERQLKWLISESDRAQRAEETQKRFDFDKHVQRFNEMDARRAFQHNTEKLQLDRDTLSEHKRQFDAREKAAMQQHLIDAKAELDKQMQEAMNDMREKASSPSRLEFYLKSIDEMENRYIDEHARILGWPITTVLMRLIDGGFAQRLDEYALAREQLNQMALGGLDFMSGNVPTKVGPARDMIRKLARGDLDELDEQSDNPLRGGGTGQFFQGDGMREVPQQRFTEDEEPSPQELHRMFQEGR